MFFLLLLSHPMVTTNPECFLPAPCWCTVNDHNLEPSLKNINGEFWGKILDLLKTKTKERSLIAESHSQVIKY